MSQQAALGCVVGRFPHLETAIADRYRSDQDFRSICEDYCECIKSLARWTHETGETAVVYQEDYRELLAELEAEIVQYLERRGVVG